MTLEDQDNYRDVVNLCVKKILGLNSDAVQILKETPACNLRVVRRLARDFRYPNPLMFTMETLSREYPISVGTKKARQCNISHHH